MHACGIINSTDPAVNKTITCWGDNSANQTAGYGPGQLGFPLDRSVSPPKPLTFLSVSAGFNYTCGLLTNQTALCWGSNSWNKANITGSSLAGGVFSHSGPWRQIAASAGPASTTCGLMSTNATTCWGNNVEKTAENVPEGVSWSAISSHLGGGGHACALTTAGIARCWGLNSTRQCNVSSNALCIYAVYTYVMQLNAEMQG
jgi:hypothetical protein